MTTQQLAKLLNFFVYHPIWTFDTQMGAKLAKYSLKKVEPRCTAVFMQHRVQKPYKAKCAKTMIAYEMKNVHDKKKKKRKKDEKNVNM